MTSADILIAARARLTPETWGQGDTVIELHLDCAGLAICRAAQGIFFAGHPPLDRSEGVYWATLGLVARCATGVPDPQLIPVWNDAVGRTLAEVHALFDAAIAIAQQQEVSAAVPA